MPIIVKPIEMSNSLIVIIAACIASWHSTVEAWSKSTRAMNDALVSVPLVQLLRTDSGRDYLLFWTAQLRLVLPFANPPVDKRDPIL